MFDLSTRLDLKSLRRAAIACSILSLAAMGTASAAGPSTTLSSKAPAAAALVSAAASKGTVPVIITLNVPPTLAATAATPAGDAALKANIKAVVDPFLTETLGVARVSAASVAASGSSSTKAAPSTEGDASGVKVMTFVPIVAKSVSAAELERIAADPRVKSIVRDELNFAVLTQSVPLIGGDSAATAGATGAGRMVAVLDSGVQYTHPFVSPRVTNAACFSTTGSGYTTLCPNGQSSQIGGNAGVNCTGNDDCRHGTHVAGIAAGNLAGGTPPRGVAPQAKIFSVQVFSRPSSGRLGAFTSDIISGLNRIYSERVALNIASVNMSLGGGQFFSACDSDARASIIGLLRAGGVAVAIASGNDGYTNAVSAPGCITAATTVGSSTKGDVISSFSNSSSMVDLIAPGSSITSSVPTSAYASFNGTSMATPHVAGAFAALKSAVPAATVAQIETALKVTGVPIADNRSGGTITRPRINVYLALLYLKGQPQPPANDNFAGAISVVPSALATTTVTGTNVSATLQAGEPRGNSSVSATVWWKFTATRTETVQLSTSGSPFDTTLGVYRGSSVSALTTVAFNDDVNGAADRTSKVTFATTSGLTYYVQVGGFGSARGVAKLNFDHPPPANDAFASAINITLVSNAATKTGSNNFATTQTGEPKFKSQVTRTIWYKFTATATRQYELNTVGSAFDTTLAIYRGAALTSLTQVAADDDSGGSFRSLARATLTAGTVYYVQVGGYNLASGTVKLNIKPFGPANDMLASARVLGGTLTAAIATNNLNATLESGEVLAIPQIRATVWFRFVATASKTVDVTTSGSAFDTTLAILTLGGTKGTRLVTFNDDNGTSLTSRVRFAAVAGQTYYIQVGGYGGATGAISLGFPTGAAPLSIKSASR